MRTRGPKRVQDTSQPRVSEYIQYKTRTLLSPGSVTAAAADELSAAGDGVAAAGDGVAAAGAGVGAACCASISGAWSLVCFCV